MEGRATKGRKPSQQEEDRKRRIGPRDRSKNLLLNLLLFFFNLVPWDSQRIGPGEDRGEG